MKKWLVGFTCVLLANTAWGQNPAPATPSGQACPQQGKTICVPEPSIKIKVSIKYSATPEKVCAPGCSFFPFFGQCQSCDSGNCGTAYTKRYLVKKIVTAEEPTVKCVPVTAPACATCGTLQRVQPGAYAPTPQPGSVAPSIEVLPVPPIPSKK